MDTDTAAGDQAENMFWRKCHWHLRMPTFPGFLSGLLWFHMREEVDEKGKTKTCGASER